MGILNDVADLFRKVSEDVYTMTDKELDDHLNQLTTDVEVIKKAKQIFKRVRDDEKIRGGQI